MEMVRLNGLITISRRIGNNETEVRPIALVLIDDSSGLCICEILLSLEDFALVLTGQGRVACQVDLNRTDLFGKVLETKQELVLIPDDMLQSSFSSSGDRQRLRTVVAEFEVDGWRGRDDDLFNHHNWRFGPDNRKAALVWFQRYVDSSTEPPRTEGS